MSSVRVETGPFSTAPGPRRVWSYYTIWAEDGLVFMEDTAEGAVTVLTCAAARARLSSWVQGETAAWDLRRTAAVNGTEKGFCTDMFFKMRKMGEVLDETLTEARRQGDQNDPEVAKQKLTEFMRRKVAGQVGARSALGGMEKYLGRMHGVPLARPRIYTGGY